MERDELEQAASVEQLAAAVERYGDDLQRLHGHDHPAESVREVTYKGHHIRIVTTYDISVDGVPITGHLLITNEGSVHYHAIPNQEFESMVDLVKRIIDLTPDGFGEGHGGHGGHQHGGHEHGGHGGHEQGGHGGHEHGGHEHGGHGHGPGG
jgi:xanthine dehydrogenase molybdopterin-binding subunit B